MIKKLVDKLLIYQKFFLKLIIPITFIVALLRMKIAFYRLLWDIGEMQAMDLKIFHTFATEWFAGKSYLESTHSYNYPPASYIFFWSLFGWLELDANRWFFAITCVFCFGYFIYLAIKESELKNNLSCLYLGLVIVAMYPTSVMIGNGQITIHTLLPLLLSILLIEKNQGTWLKDTGISILIIFALVKPNITIPFCILIFFTSKSYRPIILTILGYLALSFWASSYQESNLLELILLWLKATGETLIADFSYGSLQSWLAWWGMPKLILPAAFVLLLVHTVWLYFYKKEDVWLLLGITAIITRIWTYHGIYDDLLMIIPLIAIIRLCHKQLDRQVIDNVSERDDIAYLLVIISWFFLLAPSKGFDTESFRAVIFRGGQTIFWFTMLIFLLIRTHQSKYASNSRFRKM